MVSDCIEGHKQELKDLANNALYYAMCFYCCDIQSVEDAVKKFDLICAVGEAEPNIDNCVIYSPFESYNGDDLKNGIENLQSSFLSFHKNY